MLRLALIGACGRAADDYAQAAARLRGTRLTAVVHQEESARKHAADAAGATIATPTLAELLDAHAADFDAVLLHGPLSQRAEMASRAALAGKHVSVDSWAALSIAQVEAMASSCRAAGVRLMVGQPERFEPSTAAVKSAFDSGKLGAPALLRTHCWAPGDARGPAGIVTENVETMVAQRLDLAAWLFRQPPTEIFASANGAPPDPSAWPEYVQLHLGFPQGGMALISIARSLPAGDGYQTLSLIGSTGAAYADGHYQMQLAYRGGEPRAIETGAGIVALTAQVREFAGAVAEKREPSMTAADAQTALLLTAAARQSLANGQPMYLQEGDGLSYV